MRPVQPPNVVAMDRQMMRVIEVLVVRRRRWAADVDCCCCCDGCCASTNRPDAMTATMVGDRLCVKKESIRLEKVWGGRRVLPGKYEGGADVGGSPFRDRRSSM